MKYEVKIGLLALVAIGLSIWGYKFIQGSNLLSSSNNYYVEYEDVAGLTVGTPVQISGVAVGSVSDMILDQQTRMVRVELDIRRGVNIPTTTVATIKSVSVLGEKAISLSYDAPCFDEDDCLEEGATLRGKTAGILDMFLPENESGGNPMDGFKDQLNGVVDSLEYTLFDPNSDNPIAKSTNDLAEVMQNLKGTTYRLSVILDRNGGRIDATMRNVAAFTGTLSDKQAQLASIIDNAESVSGELTELQIKETMAEINTAVTELKGTLQEADKAVASVNNIMTDVSEGKGSLGKLLTSDELYNKLDAATAEADTLFSDFQERPYRYVPFKSRRRVLRHDRKDAERAAELEEARSE